MTLDVEVPRGFEFRRTVASHGWALLAPFRIAPDTTWLETVVAVGGGRARVVRIDAAGRRPGTVAVRTPGRLGASGRARLVAAVRRILGLDLRLDPFWETVRDHPDHAWMARERVGRLLRAPSMWEDLVKLVLTTNCSWSLTTRMTSNLVEHWGARAPGGRRAFPDAATVASIGEPALREVGRTGYRAPYLAALARAVAEGTVDLDAFERDPRPAAALRRDLLRLPGVGPYVAENLLKFQARPAGLALDSWMRAKYARLHHGGRPVRDRTIARRHARLGPWAGLALWFELTRDWHEDGEPGEAWDGLA